MRQTPLPQAQALQPVLVTLQQPLVTGLSCIGGGIVVASEQAQLLELSARIPASLVNPFIFVGLAEGVCLYGLIISFMIISRL